MIEGKQIDVLIVEDSKVAQEHLTHILEADKAIRVIGTAADGDEAVAFVRKKRPDVITMDIHMPGMNGLEATRRIMETSPAPIIIVSASYDRNDVEKAFLSMEAGALAIVEKPVGEAHPLYGEAAKELVQTVKLMSEVKVVRRWKRKRPSEPLNAVIPEEILEKGPKDIRLVAIGASTGGPPVLQTILSALSAGFPAPILIVQHIATGFVDGMLDWLRQTTALPIHIAMNREHLLPGHVYFAPDGFHLGVYNQSRISLSNAPPENGVRPSVSYLFRSAMGVFGENLAAVLLTGMGRDGAEELRMLLEKGAVTIAQDRESSVVYGMPGEAVNLKAARYILPPEKIASALIGLARDKKTDAHNRTA